MKIADPVNSRFAAAVLNLHFFYVELATIVCGRISYDACSFFVQVEFCSRFGEWIMERGA